MRTSVLHTFQAEAAGGRIAKRRAKRLFDIALSVIVLVAFSPVFILIALAIRCESRGPAMFRQLRGGEGGRPFRIYKFRSMRDGYDAAVHQATAGDARITRVGAFLRRSNLDELPQLLNVLRGEMSIVGPRPHAVAHDAAFARWVKGYEGRFAAKPGLTGLAQINGHRGEIRTRVDLERRLADDLAYIARQSLLLDLRIALLTLVPHRGFRNAR